MCAHPDDESFGLGAALHSFARQGAQVSVLCFTHGEASTLGRCTSPGGLRDLRAQELASAAEVLGLRHVELLSHPDGALTEVPLFALAAEVERAAADSGAELLLVFDDGGITGHPDHCRATEAALAAGGGHPILAWAVTSAVAEVLNEEYGTAFVGRGTGDIDVEVDVDRAVQRRAIACHASQAVHNPVLDRRLELSGDTEVLRWLRRPGMTADAW